MPRGSSHTDPLCNLCPHFLLLQHAVLLWKALWLQKWSLYSHMQWHQQTEPEPVIYVWKFFFFFFYGLKEPGYWEQCDHFRSIFWLCYIDVWLSVKIEHDVFKNCVFGGLMEATGRQDLRQSHSGRVKDPFAASCQTMGESGLKNMWWRSRWLRVTVWLVSIQPQTDHDNHLTGGGLIM